MSLHWRDNHEDGPSIPDPRYSPDSNSDSEPESGREHAVVGRKRSTAGRTAGNRKGKLMKRKFTWVDWVYYGACFGLMGYTVYAVYSMRDEDGTGKLHALRLAKAVCESTARTVGQWGMKADVAYHRIIESERMI